MCVKTFCPWGKSPVNWEQIWKLRTPKSGCYFYNTHSLILRSCAISQFPHLNSMGSSHLFWSVYGHWIIWRQQIFGFQVITALIALKNKQTNPNHKPLFLSYCKILHRDPNYKTFQKYSHVTWKGYSCCNTDNHRTCTDTQGWTDHTATLMHSNPWEMFLRMSGIQSIWSFNSRMCENDTLLVNNMDIWCENDTFLLNNVDICLYSEQIQCSVPFLFIFSG